MSSDKDMDMDIVRTLDLPVETLNKEELKKQNTALRSRVGNLESELDRKNDPMEIDLFRQEANELQSENISLRREIRRLNKRLGLYEDV